MLQHIRSWLILACLLAAVPRTGQAAKLVGWWSFEGNADSIEDRSGNGLHGTAAGCSRAAGPVGRALKLDGSTGMTVPDSPLMKFSRGFALECWVKFDRPPGPPMNIISKPMEFMLRVDPAAAGGTISLFVRCDDGAWEPRARGPKAEPGKWYRIAASWDRHRARLWVNRKFVASIRRGTCPPQGEPLVIGGPVSGMAGLSGMIDEARIYTGAIAPVALARMAHGMAAPAPAEQRRDARFEFRSSLEGWQGEGDLAPVQRDGMLCATLTSDDSLLKVTGLAVDAAANPVCTIRMSASGGLRGLCIFSAEKMFKVVPFRLIADGEMHTYTLRCAQQGLWEGTIGAMGLRVQDARDMQIKIDWIRLDRTSHAPPDVRILSLSPERRINGLNQAVTVTAWLRNFGGPVRDVTARLTPPPGVEVQGEPAAKIPSLGFDEQAELSWNISARAPCRGDIRLDVACQESPHAAMVRPVRFCDNPDAAAVELARSRPWLKSGYPRAMDFRHLYPKSVAFLEHNTVLLVDFINGKIGAAREFKRRYPDRLVLMQVNDEVNGIWGSWHSVPREFAVKEKLEYDPAIFPMPEFRGYWLLGPGAVLTQDVPADAETFQVRVQDTKWFVLERGARTFLRDVLVYGKSSGKPDWNHSEYASVVEVDEKKNLITVKRWPREAVGGRRSFRAGEAYVAPSVGSIYTMGDRTLKTWVPNLTKFCPRDPKTGMDAVTWWAKHFADLWHDRIAASEPHPDGYEFDGLEQGATADCDNDGIVDGCVIGGINYWRLGLYDFFRKLRDGGDGWRGISPDLILADASSVWSPRSLGLLNGSENEEFPSFAGFRYLPSGLDLYRTWCAGAAPPSCSYLQGRFSCDTYLDQDWLRVAEGRKFHGDNVVRLSIACACMGTGIYTYRTGSRRDIAAIISCEEILEYPWDEYHCGRDGTYNWLGMPITEPMRMTDHLGPDLLPNVGSSEGWELLPPAEGVSVKGPRTTTLEARQAVEAEITSIDTTGRPRQHRHVAAARAVLLAPPTPKPLDPDKEYSVDFWMSADPGYDKKEGKRFAGVWRWVGVCLRAGDRNGTTQWFLVNPPGRHVAMTLRPPQNEPCRVAFLIGGELGPVRIADLRLREGCAEVFCRRFEHGLVLANGSALSPYTADIAGLGAGRKYRRFNGAQAPDVNNGRPVGLRVTVPPMDGLLLSTFR